MCPHATTTTVAWLFHEADDAHADHVAACPDCTAVLEEHERVATALIGVLPALRVPSESAPRRALRGPRLRLRFFRWRAALAAAAVLAVGLGVWRLLPGTSPTHPVHPVHPVQVAESAAPPDGFDTELDDLDLDVTSLELEML